MIPTSKTVLKAAPTHVSLSRTRGSPVLVEDLEAPNSARPSDQSSANDDEFSYKYPP